MKMTRKNLKNLIAEELSSLNTSSVLLEMPQTRESGMVPYQKDPDGYEGNMAKKALYHLARQADQLHDMLADDENLEPWVQAKITKAADYIKNAFESLTYEKDNPKGR